MSVASAKFAVIAEKQGYPRTLYLHDLTFERLIEEVVTPYETKKPFFIDGVPVKRDDLLRIKIVQQTDAFEHELVNLHHFLTLGKASSKGVTAEDYPVRFDALFRSAGADVTSSIIRAFGAKILPDLRDVASPETLAAAFTFFSEIAKRLS